MKIIKYIILGIIQGLTEPLPISSSGHVFLFKELFNTNMFNDTNFEIFVNFGSFLAIFLIFWKDIKNLLTSFIKYLLSKEDQKKKYVNEFKYCMLIIIGSIPVGIIGFLFKDTIESWISIKEVAISLLFTALMLFIVRNSNGTKKDNDITYKDAIIIGLMQIIALLPGISRSGTVLVGCLLCKLNKESSLKYTFMLYFPVSCASMLLGVKDIIEAGNLNTIIVPYSLGMIAAAIVTYYSYKWLSSIVKNGKLWYFSIYCILAALFTLIWFR
ncbi:MAG: undecaprenyl-diphosphate phosphatase [Bacilli bacterium]